MKRETIDLFNRIFKVLEPPPDLTLSQWADRYRRLSSESGSKGGKWNTEKAPWQREIMDAITDISVEKVVVMSAAQMGKTDAFLLNTIGYYMHYDPCTILCMQPTLSLAETMSKDRLMPMVRDTPALRDKINEKSRTAGNTIFKKAFPGGRITMSGANSPTELRSRPIRILLADEIDAYPPTAGAEGDPLILAGKRLTTYWNRKEVDTSTPTTIWNIVAPIVQGILQVVQAVMPVILSVVQSVIGSVQGIIQNLMTVLSGIIDFVTGVFTGNWSQAWNGIKSIFSGAVGGLGEIIKAPLRAVVSAVNTVIGGLNKLKVPDWVPGLGGKGINIPLIPGFAKGTDRTPGTFIAGENGPELITNAANRKVFTAAQTGQIFNNISQAQTADNVSARMSGAGTIVINVQNSPSVVVNGNGEANNIKQQLEQYDEAFLEKLRAIIVAILKEQKEQEDRVVYA